MFFFLNFYFGKKKKKKIADLNFNTKEWDAWWKQLTWIERQEAAAGPRKSGSSGCLSLLSAVTDLRWGSERFLTRIVNGRRSRGQSSRVSEARFPGCCPAWDAECEAEVKRHVSVCGGEAHRPMWKLQQQKGEGKKVCVWADKYQNKVGTSPPLSLSLSRSVPCCLPPTVAPSSTSTEEVGLAACYSAPVYVNVHVCGVWHLKEVRYCIRTQWMQVLI